MHGYYTRTHHDNTAETTLYRVSYKVRNFKTCRHFFKILLVAPFSSFLVSTNYSDLISSYW